MADDLELYTRVADRFTELVDGVTPEQMSRPTPCEGWTVEDLIVHVIERDRGLSETLDPDHTEEADTDRRRRILAGERVTLGPDDDISAAWLAQRAWWGERLAEPAIANRELDTYFGRMTFAQAVVSYNLSELTIHAWDLARGIGTDARLDHEAVSRACAMLTLNAAQIPRPGPLGEELEPPAGADTLTQLLALAGRRA